jgi:hypothetical protein
MSKIYELRRDESTRLADAVGDRSSGGQRDDGNERSKGEPHSRLVLVRMSEKELRSGRRFYEYLNKVRQDAITDVSLHHSDVRR